MLESKDCPLLEAASNQLYMVVDTRHLPPQKDSAGDRRQVGRCGMGFGWVEEGDNWQSRTRKKVDLVVVECLHESTPKGLLSMQS